MIISKFIDIFILKVIKISCIGLFCVVYGGFCVVAYIKQEFTIYLISIIFWFLVLSFWAIKVTMIVVFSFSILFFNIYYLNLRFKQLYSLNMITVNKLLIIYRHNKLSMMTYQSNNYFKYTMAYSYFIATIIDILTYITFFYGNGVLLFRLAVLIVGLFGFVLMFLVSQFSANLSREANRFYETMNSFNCLAKLDIKQKLKVSLNSFKFI